MRWRTVLSVVLCSRAKMTACGRQSCCEFGRVRAMADGELSHEAQAHDAQEAPPQDATNEQPVREEGEFEPVVGPVEDELFGKRIRKCFGSRRFWGTIVEAYVVNRGLFYKVSFDDGDVDILSSEEIRADLKETELHVAEDPAVERPATTASESSSLTKTTPYMDVLRAKKASLKRRREEAPEVDGSPTGPWEVRLWSSRLYATIMEVNGFIRLEDFVPMANGDKGELEATGKVKKGDALLSIHGRIVHGVMTHLQASNMIRTAPRPLTLTFFRPKLDASAGNLARDLTAAATPPSNTTTSESGSKKARVEGMKSDQQTETNILHDETTTLTSLIAPDAEHPSSRSQRPSTPEVEIVQVVPPVQPPSQPPISGGAPGANSSHLRNESDRWSQVVVRPTGYGAESMRSYFQPQHARSSVGRVEMPRAHHVTHTSRVHASSDREREMHRHRQYPSEVLAYGYRGAPQTSHALSRHPAPHGSSSAYTMNPSNRYMNIPNSSQRTVHGHQPQAFNPSSNARPVVSRPSQRETREQYQTSSSHIMSTMNSQYEGVGQPAGFHNTNTSSELHQYNQQHRQASEYGSVSSRGEKSLTVGQYLKHFGPGVQEERASRSQVAQEAAPPMQPLSPFTADRPTNVISRTPAILRGESPAPEVRSHASSREPSPAKERTASPALDEGTSFLRLNHLGEESSSLVDSAVSSFLSINEKSFAENLPSGAAVSDIFTASGARADTGPSVNSIGLHPQRPRFLSKFDAGDIVEVVVTQPRLFMTLGITGNGNFVSVSSFVRGENGEVGEIEASGKVLPGDVLLGLDHVEIPPFMPPGEVAKIVVRLPRPYSAYFMRATWDML